MSRHWDLMLIDLLEDESDTMSAWEVEFIESLTKQAKSTDTWEPSDKQRAKLSDIWKKVIDSP